MTIASSVSAGSELEFRVLGPIEVRREGKLIPLGAAKQRALLSILLLNLNQIVPASRLIDLLWGDEPPASARSALHVYVSQLRKLLEPQRPKGATPAVLQSLPSGYVLRLESHQLDLSRFVGLLEAGRTAAAAGEPLAAAGHLRNALALWHGVAFADCASERFAESEVARLDEMRLLALEERIDADLAIGRHTDVLAELQGLSLAYPLRERIGRQLMLALYRAGRQGEASEVYQRTRRAMVDQLAMEPGAEMQALLKAILTQDPDLDPAGANNLRTRRSNLPRRLPGFVGREAQIEEITQALAKSALVTLTGAGGVGKTRLALEIGHRLLETYRDGVWFVDFSSVKDRAVIVDTLMYALGLRVRGGNASDVLTGFLKGRDQLLILDNCEHLINPMAQVVSHLCEECPDIHVLVTSREPLRVGGEVHRRIAPLTTPDVGATVDLQSLLLYESVALFCECARQACGEFALTEANALAVVTICRLLDGIPLALELAARRLTVLSIDDLQQRMSRSFRVLAGGRSATPRHGTMSEAIAWSYDLLTEPERAVFRRLSVFAGGFTASEAETVCAPEDPGIDLLSRLVDKSLVLPAGEGRRGGRLRILDVLRQFGRDRLVEANEEGQANYRHAAFFVDEAERLAPLLRSRDQAWALEQFELEHDNIRAAIAWCQAVGHGDLAVRLVAATWLFWYIRGYGAEGLRRAVGVRTLFGVDLPMGGEVLIACAKLAWQQHDIVQADDAAVQAIAYFESRRDPRGTGLAHLCLANNLDLKGETDAAETGFQTALKFLLVSNDQWGASIALNNLGMIAIESGRYDDAERYLGDSLELAVLLGDPWRKQMALGSLAELCLAREAAGRAAQFMQQSFVLQRQTRNIFSLPFDLEICCRIALAFGAGTEALRFAGAAAGVRRRFDSNHRPDPRIRQVLEIASRSVEPDAADAALKVGTEMAVEVTIESAIEWLSVVSAGQAGFPEAQAPSEITPGA